MRESKSEKLSSLKEYEKIYIVCLRQYDPNKVIKDIQEIDQKIGELVVKKKGIVDKRQNVSPIKLAQLKQQLRENKIRQELLLDSNGLLKKLAKTIKIIKETENLVEV